MPLYDFYCEKCGIEELDVLCKSSDGIVCKSCIKPMKRRCNCTHFKLTYNNKTDMCDWQGNSSNYWKDVKAAKERGEKVKGLGED
jgi:predicted nucleic acid-binding Zn ribbon protein